MAAREFHGVIFNQWTARFSVLQMMPTQVSGKPLGIRRSDPGQERSNLKNVESGAPNRTES
jgi:hypothetical protein